MSKWRLRFASDEAADEAASLFENAEVKAECLRLLKLLAEENNPAKPQNSELNVRHLEHDAPNWYRLRIDRYKIRIIFSLIFGENEQIIEYIYGEAIFDDAENYLRLQLLAYRSKYTYIEARRRWRKAHRK
jgi:hypothetical protein